MTGKGLITFAGVLLLATAPGGCTYDYMQHSDRVSYHAGDAVKANLEAETTNPANFAMYDTRGLGRNGDVIPTTASSTTTSSTASTGAAASTTTTAGGTSGP